MSLRTPSQVSKGHMATDKGKRRLFLILTTTGQNISKVNTTEMNINSDLQKKHSTTKQRRIRLCFVVLCFFCRSELMFISVVLTLLIFWPVVVSIRKSLLFPLSVAMCPLLTCEGVLKDMACVYAGNAQFNRMD